jgi:hypothetical protein
MNAIKKGMKAPLALVDAIPKVGIHWSAGKVKAKLYS